MKPSDQYTELKFVIRNAFGVLGRTQVTEEGEVEFVLDPYLRLTGSGEYVALETWPNHYPTKFDLVYAADDSLHLVYARIWLSAALDVYMQVNTNAVLPVKGEFMRFRVQPTP